MIKVSFKQTQFKIALIFAFASSLLIMVVTVLMFIILTYQLDLQAKHRLEDKIKQVSQNYVSNDLVDINISFQKRNLSVADRSVHNLESLPNIRESGTKRKANG